MAETILENRDRINVLVTTYDMAAKKEDNKFMRRLRPDVSIKSYFLEDLLMMSRFVYMMKVIY
jgi:hypothetical protein